MFLRLQHDAHSQATDQRTGATAINSGVAVVKKPSRSQDVPRCPKYTSWAEFVLWQIIQTQWAHLWNDCAMCRNQGTEPGLVAGAWATCWIIRHRLPCKKKRHRFIDVITWHYHIIVITWRCLTETERFGDGLRVLSLGKLSARYQKTCLLDIHSSPALLKVTWHWTDICLLEKSKRLAHTSKKWSCSTRMKACHHFVFMLCLMPF